MTDEDPGRVLDLWSWAGVEQQGDEPAPIDPGSVTAVLVVHNAEDWLPQQLQSLAQLAPRPGRIVAVDNGSSDGSRSLLEAGLADTVVDDLLDGSEQQGFGDAVAQALDGQSPDWIWLLHDDSIPQPGALGELLDGAARTGAAILVPKLLQPRRRNYPETISEIGQSITRGGRRVQSLDEGDIDQGQATSEPVLGGSTAGMLVRGEVWRELGGLAPELPLHRDGVDLGWRALDAGHTVITWPSATLTHRQAGRTGERASALAASAHEADRLAALRVAAARGERPARPTVLLLSSWLRAAGFLLAKSPALARDELRALGRFRRTPELTASLKERSVPAEDAALAEVLPPRFWGVRHAFDQVGAVLTERYRDITTSEGGTGIDELTGDDFAGSGLYRRRRISERVLLFLVLLVAGLAAGRTLLGGGSVAGGGMLPAPSTLSDAWSAFLVPTAGSAGAGAPWLMFAALASTVSLGGPGWFALASLVLVPLLAALAADRLLRRVGASARAAALGGLLWAAAVLLLGIITAGDVSGMVLAVAGPLGAVSVLRMVRGTASGAERLRAPGATAFWLAVASAVWPFMLVLALVAAVVWVVRDRDRWLEVLIGVGLPILFMLPWFPTLFRWPGRIMTGADPLAWPNFPPAGLAALAGRIMPSGLPLAVSVAFFAVLGIAWLLTVPRVPRASFRLTAGVALAVPLVLGVALSRFSFDVAGGESRALLSGWALMVVAAVLVPLFLPREEDADASHAGIGRARVVGAWCLLAAGLLAAGTWAVVGFRGPVQQSQAMLPGYVTDVISSPRDTRVLMIELDGQDHLSWNVVDAGQPMWGTGERSPAGSFGTEFAGLVQAFSGGDTPEDVAARLTALGASHVWMKGFGEERIAAIGNAPGLSRSAADDNTVVWTVLGQPSRATLQGNSAAEPVVDGSVAASDVPRRLQLAEEPDSRWWARIGGTSLKVDVERPPVTFEVPAGVSGRLEYGLGTSTGSFVWQIVLLVALGVLAAPTLGSQTRARRVA